jgi:hypothetical protein
MTAAAVAADANTVREMTAKSLRFAQRVRRGIFFGV